MKKTFTKWIAVTCIMLFTGLCYGDDSDKPKVEFFGMSSMEMGQVVKAHSYLLGPDTTMLWQFMRTIYAGLGANVTFDPSNSFTLNILTRMYNEVPIQHSSTDAARQLLFYTFIQRAEYSHIFLDDKDNKLELGAGFFPYKYNEDSRNLGEYLFRSGIYPQTLVTDFDNSSAQLCGIRLSNTMNILGNTLKQDLLLYENDDWYAIHDINIAYVGSYNIGHCLEIGAGVSFNSVWSADSNVTTPSITNGNAFYGDSIPYSFAGIKVMGRVSFDPKKLLSIDNLGLGKEDLKIYSEAAILGLKDYPMVDSALSQYYGLDSNGQNKDKVNRLNYNDILRRIPIMIGFNVPTFGLLDVFSVEGEWFNDEWENTYRYVADQAYSNPVPDMLEHPSKNLKWSFYGTKTIQNHFHITGQIASDHLRIFSVNESTTDWEEICKSPHEWYYLLKFGVSF